MAITDAGQMCESSAITTTTRMTLSSTSCPAGGLMVLHLGGRVSSGTLDLVSVTDSKGGTWNYQKGASGYRAAFLAWRRSLTPLVAGTDWVEVRWSKAPQVAWISGHVHLNAGATKIDGGWSQGSPGSTASKTISVSGSDFLVLATVTYAYDLATTTPLNSMTEQDTFAGTNVFVEALSRNHTSGSTFQAGTSFSASRYWSVIAVSLPFEAIPAGARSSIGLFGAV